MEPSCQEPEPCLFCQINAHELSCQVGGRGVQVTCSVLGAVENCSRMAGGQGSVQSVCASGAKWTAQHSAQQVVNVTQFCSVNG